jgi:hypothetical protein
MLQRDAVRKLKLDGARSANSGKSADPILHRSSPDVKIRSKSTGAFKN